MVICSCNNINEAKLEQAKCAGIRSPHKAFAMFGGKVCCGTCCPLVTKILNK